MKRLIFPALLALTLAAALPAQAQTRVEAGRTATVFGRGPEVHLLPGYGPKGTRVIVVGLGYRPGARVQILYGPPNSEFASTPLATVTVGSQGRFRTTFVVRGSAQPTLTPLIIGAFAGSQSATTAFIITPA